MTVKTFAALMFLLSIPAFAKDVTYRLTGAEPLTFTIPDDWSSAWSPMMCSGFDPDAPVDLISFSKSQPVLPGGAPAHGSDHGPALLIDARRSLVPLSKMNMHLRKFDADTQAILPAKELHGRTDGTLLGYYNTDASSAVSGKQRLDVFWNLGSRTWSANSTFPADQTNWVAECVAILESVRLADPETAPPTPKRPTINGVDDPDFPEEALEKWRRQHE